LVDFTRMWGFY